jgi:uncharacterized protein YqjF (DUF2071 family)
MGFCNRLPWLVGQREQELLFLHWSLTPELIRPLVPPQFELDLRDGVAWVTMIPFRMSGLHARWLPPMPLLSTFAEVDLITYVRAGSVPGVTALRIDAATTVGTWVGRFFSLPYHHSQVTLTTDGGWRRFTCRGQPTAGGIVPELAVRYRPAGPEHTAAPGTLAYFLVECFDMYSVTSAGRVLSARETRPPRVIQAAEVTLEKSSLLAAVGLPEMPPDPVMWYCRECRIHTWLPAPAAISSANRRR